jgi:hypothetical protein
MYKRLKLKGMINFQNKSKRSIRHKHVSLSTIAWYCVLFIGIFSSTSQAQVITKVNTLQVGETNTTSHDTSSALQIDATNRGFLPPRITTQQRNAIVSPKSGLVIYNITTNCLEWFQDNAWYNACGANNISSNGTAVVASWECSVDSSGDMIINLPVDDVTQTVSAQVVAIGNYEISASAGGVTFSATGRFTSTGPQTIVLKAVGKPIVSGNTPFVLNTIPNCSFERNVLGFIPSVPTNPVAVAKNAGAIVSFGLSASLGNGMISYTVLSNPPGGSATGTDSPIVVPNLTNGTSYTFTVKATNNEGSSNFSNPSNEVTPTATVPGVPLITNAIAGDTKATLLFTAPLDNGGMPITSYTLTSSDGLIVINPQQSPIEVTGLTNGTTYTFTLLASNAIGNSISSVPVSVTPLPPPSLPIILSVTQTSQSNATVEIVPPSGKESSVLSYTVTVQPINVTVTASGPSIEVSGLTTGQSYTFYAVATNSAGNSITSEPFGPFTLSNTTGALLTNYFNGVIQN